jgi:hypothetical protein
MSSTTNETLERHVAENTMNFRRCQNSCVNKREAEAAVECIGYEDREKYVKIRCSKPIAGECAHDCMKSLKLKEVLVSELFLRNKPPSPQSHPGSLRLIATGKMQL